MTDLASGAITAVDTVTIELGEAVETPAIVIVRWPAKATVFPPAVSVWRGFCCPRQPRRRREARAASTGATAVSLKDGEPAATRLRRRGWADRTLEASASCGPQRQSGGPAPGRTRQSRSEERRVGKGG